jgi:hypothetical protein
VHDEQRQRRSDGIAPTLQEISQVTTKIEGIIKPDIGQGFTLENYKVIISEIAKHFDGVKNCGKYGTINVTSLKPPLRKSFADYWTPRIRWKPIMGMEPERHEMYGLIKINFECPPEGKTYEAWIIMPEGYTFSYDENQGVEIILETYISDAKPGAPCAISIDHKPSTPRPSDFGDVVSQHLRRLIENHAAVPR